SEEPEVPTESEEPEVPTESEEPEVPTESEEPEVPTESEEPEAPKGPKTPKAPTESEAPTEPEAPEAPTEPEVPETPTEPEAPETPKVHIQEGKDEKAIIPEIKGPLHKTITNVAVADPEYLSVSTGEINLNKLDKFVEALENSQIVDYGYGSPAIRLVIYRPLDVFVGKKFVVYCKRHVIATTTIEDST
ncbi:12149_t:CDS:2, partial [Racocetra persica]